MLVDAVMAGVPDPNLAEAFAAWLNEQRQAWTEQIDTSTLAWFQRAKLPLGAFSTLLWIQVVETDRDQPGAFGAYRLRGFAIGDSCLFHVRRGELVRSFPLQTSAEFQADPLVLGSIDLKRDHLMRFTALDELCYPDDLLVLCTDALAEWAMRMHEAARRARLGPLSATCPKPTGRRRSPSCGACATSATTTRRWCCCACWPATPSPAPAQAGAARAPGAS